jgi:hypothetical protein
MRRVFAAAQRFRTRIAARLRRSGRILFTKNFSADAAAARAGTSRSRGRESPGC